MKFAKELENELVPEWRIKYLNYKGGKKLIKQITKALHKANSNTPYSSGRQGQHSPGNRFIYDLSPPNNNIGPSPNGADSAGRKKDNIAAGDSTGPTVNTDPGRPADREHLGRGRGAVSTGDLAPYRSAPQTIPTESEAHRREKLSLTGNSPRFHYGSFVLTPPTNAPSLPPPPPSNDDDFALPDPALKSTPSQHHTTQRPVYGERNASALSLGTPAMDARRSSSVPGLSNFDNPRNAGVNRGQGAASTRRETPRQGTLTRLFSSTDGVRGTSIGNLTRKTAAGDLSDFNLQAWDQVKKRNEDFVKFLNDELHKVEDFYKLKETQAGQRLDLLREQLHEMRNRRTDELIERKRIVQRRKGEAVEDASNEMVDGDGYKDDADGKGIAETMGEPHAWIDPIKAKVFRPGPNSKALQKMARTPTFGGEYERQGQEQLAATDDRRDYTRRPIDDDVPYRTAKRKLKLALQEFYRGLELLKAYALLNRTAFRKLNKKYDKAVHPRTSYKFMTEHVNKAWFVNSDVLDQHVRVVEDLYARYFERGNHKIAVGKLRGSKKGTGDESGSAFRCGILLGTGLVFAIQGLITAVNILLHSSDSGLRQDTSYLLQVYGGYFLMLYLLLLFCLDCRQWTKSKVNYPFIFELDPRHHLDWRQLAEFPCFFTFVFGIIFWFNFTGYGGENMFLWWPVVLIGISAVLIFLPLPILGYKSRLWFVYSHWRLCLAGIYPVEFRDFFLGDIYCSLTYAVCNVELFFCLYANEWDNPPQCNSSHSRLMGFLGALPPIWRALQCIRRYYDTRNVFPHLVNCGKYSMTIMSAVTLSMYRVQSARSNLALFIAFSTINGVYASFWDLFMDFSLMQLSPSKPTKQQSNFLLRDILAFKRKWMYYGIIIIDPILRFSWIFYAIFTHNVQHSALVSFMVAFAEATRRGMWALFRVENEHSSNVKQYKASRDVPLPYRIEPLVELGEEGGESGTGSVVSSRASTVVTATAENTAKAPSRRMTAVTVSPKTLPRRQEQTISGEERLVTTAMPNDGTASATGRDGQGRRPSAATSTATTVRQRTRRRRATTTASSAVRGLGRILAEAHKQDFEKKRKPTVSTRGGEHHEDAIDDDDDDDDSEEEEEEADGIKVGEVTGGEDRDDSDDDGYGGNGYGVDLEMAGANGPGRGSGSTRRGGGGGADGTGGGNLSVRSSRR
ncbi:signal transduction protein [Zalerion maritima]|uniref:Signal transduction protein n=1 Tax=Zalerion maritima TaxID=339359 RepID=A0AAD5RHU7_9PEZI|nr:signal transduction protein [Zalerion maritima]